MTDVLNGNLYQGLGRPVHKISDLMCLFPPSSIGNSMTRSLIFLEDTVSLFLLCEFYEPRMESFGQNMDSIILVHSVINDGKRTKIKLFILSWSSIRSTIHCYLYFCFLFLNTSFLTAIICCFICQTNTTKGKTVLVKLAVSLHNVVSLIFVILVIYSAANKVNVNPLLWMANTAKFSCLFPVMTN